MRVRWTKRARAQLVEVFAYIAADNPTAARKLMGRIRRATRALERFPRIGRMLPEIGDETVRERIVPPYRVIYLLRAKTIEVIAVHHSKRDLVSLLRKKVRKTT